MVIISHGFDLHLHFLGHRFLDMLQSCLLLILAAIKCSLKCNAKKDCKCQASKFKSIGYCLLKLNLEC